jgi:hypothetical protein
MAEREQQQGGERVAVATSVPCAKPLRKGMGEGEEGRQSCSLPQLHRRARRVGVGGALGQPAWHTMLPSSMFAVACPLTRSSSLKAESFEIKRHIRTPTEPPPLVTMASRQPLNVVSCARSRHAAPSSITAALALFTAHPRNSSEPDSRMLIDVHARPRLLEPTEQPSRHHLPPCTMTPERWKWLIARPSMMPVYVGPRSWKMPASVAQRS